MDKMTCEYIGGWELLGYWFSLCCCGKQFGKKNVFGKCGIQMVCACFKIYRCSLHFLQVDVLSFLLI